MTHPLGGVIQHLLPGRVELPLVVLEQPLLGQGDGLLGGAQHLRGPLEVLRGFLRFQLSLERKDPREASGNGRAPAGPSRPPKEEAGNRPGPRGSW